MASKHFFSISLLIFVATIGDQSSLAVARQNPFVKLLASNMATIQGKDQGVAKQADKTEGLIKGLPMASPPKPTHAHPPITLPTIPTLATFPPKPTEAHPPITLPTVPTLAALPAIPPIIPPLTVPPKPAFVP